MPSAHTLLLNTLRNLEIDLHRPAIRSDAARLDALLHEDFREFGRSGKVYTKADVLSQLPANAHHGSIVADGFEMRRLSDAVVLLTYRSAHWTAEGEVDGVTLRMSIWERAGGQGWRMRFHQGTPTGS
ncbi:nuclear transport factor 2 family protein [Acidovorax sp. GBBC 3334]|uniref:nuclear transport factor 2 family protein n=1 Tax=Acidovorax sp. GBBC 3334 TaxID=2940496 RepID=UPI002302AFE9|nr:nuclear transport factor 2 family protein [Acidovorax sp. GBBC 3334]MDA8457195.1 nuclear transport factor 2 family protein [Acidovorax sp. GBBC 3334]